MGSILIVSSPGDPHVEDIADELTRSGTNPVLVETDAFPADVSMSLSISTGGPIGGRLTSRDGRFDVVAEDVGAVWWRRPSPYYGITEELGEAQREFVRTEVDQALAGFWAALPATAYWMSHPDRIAAASWKLEQLGRAAEFGMSVPETIATTDPQLVDDFWRAAPGQVIFKVMSDPYLGAMRVAVKYPSRADQLELRETSTTVVTEEMLQELETVQASPSLFQRYVPKAFEYRVTVIGDDLFAARIDSQSAPGTTVDWRAWSDGGLDIPYSACQLPGHVEEFIMRFVKSYGLEFSAIDLIQTPEDEWVFVENNPNGQFLFVDRLVPELRMKEALASCLSRAAR